MTSIYMTKPRTTQPRPRREKKSKKPHEDAKPAIEPGALCRLGDSLREQFESTLEDYSIEVQYLGLADFLDSDPLLPELCSNHCVNTSLITYDTAMNSSIDESFTHTSRFHDRAANISTDAYYCPQTKLCFDRYGDVSTEIGYSSPNESVSKDRAAVDSDGDESLKKRGWVPRAVSDVWDNVVSSNWQCWQGTHEPSPIRSRGMVKDGNKEKVKTKKENTSFPQKARLMKKDSSYIVNPLEAKQSFADEKKQESQKTDVVEPLAIEKLSVDEKEQESQMKNVVEPPAVDEKKQESPMKDVVKPPMIKITHADEKKQESPKKDMVESPMIKKPLLDEKKRESPKKDMMEPPAIHNIISDEPLMGRPLFDIAGKENKQPSEDCSPSMACINSESLPKLDAPIDNDSEDRVDQKSSGFSNTKKKKMKWIKGKMKTRFDS